MKIDAKRFEFTNHLVGNRPLPIPFYVPDSDKKLRSLNYQAYKLRTNPKDNKLAVYNLVVEYYEVGTPEEWLQFIDAISQIIKGQDIQDSKATYTLVKRLLREMPYKSSRTKKQTRREGMAKHLQSVLEL